MSASHIVIFVMMIAVVLVLVAGVVFMMIGGKLNAKYGNKLMVARVALQALTLLLIFVLFSLSR